MAYRVWDSRLAERLLNLSQKVTGKHVKAGERTLIFARNTLPKSRLFYFYPIKTTIALRLFPTETDKAIGSTEVRTLLSPFCLPCCILEALMTFCPCCFCLLFCLYALQTLCYFIKHKSCFDGCLLFCFYAWQTLCLFAKHIIYSYGCLMFCFYGLQTLCSFVKHKSCFDDCLFFCFYDEHID